MTVHTKIRPKDVPGTLLNVVCTSFISSNNIWESEFSFFFLKKSKDL